MTLPVFGRKEVTASLRTSVDLPDSVKWTFAVVHAQPDDGCQAVKGHVLGGSACALALGLVLEQMTGMHF